MACFDVCAAKQLKSFALKQNLLESAFFSIKCTARPASKRNRMERADEKSSCSLCSRPDSSLDYDADDFMVACDVCEQWFHGKCVSLDEIDAADIAQFHCPTCARVRGPSVARAKANENRYDWSDVDGSLKPLQTGSRQFVEQLMKRQFPGCDLDVVVMENGLEFGLSYFEKNPFDRPILFKSAEHLGLTLPPRSLNLQELGNLVGMSTMVDAIDVYRQRSFRMELGKFLEHFAVADRSRVLNLISLEVSQTSLGEMITEPEIVRQISWVDLYWPQDQGNDNIIYATPEVSKFCLISMAGSYTDFHIDFSGTSVWYSPVQGSKIFYLVKPTAENLKLFEEWMSNANHSEQFFGDLASNCISLNILPGNVVFIPTGWIHAVLSPDDSIVYGGNFLHSYNIELQLQIFDMERRLDLPDKFFFPNFIVLHWHVAHRMIEIVNDYNDDEKALPSYLLNGLNALVKQLKTWQAKAKLDKTIAVPDSSALDGLNYSELLKMLNKALSSNETMVKHTRSEKKRGTATSRKLANEKDTNLKVKIRLDTGGSSKKKATGADRSNAPEERRATKKRKRAGEVGCSRKIVPYYDLGPNTASTIDFSPQNLFDAKFDQGERPLIGYSIQKLYVNPSNSSLLMSVEDGTALRQLRSSGSKENGETQIANDAKKRTSPVVGTTRGGRTLVRRAKAQNSLVNNPASDDNSEVDSNDAEYVDHSADVPSPPESPSSSADKGRKKGVFLVGQSERRNAAAKPKDGTQKRETLRGALSSRQSQSRRYKTTRERLVRKLKIDTKRMR
uniref:[Histone H3]-dimethyl-L-lysine(36) demethylase n=1 Tax=Trichuris muris TaxID=70415 RepID=A0A5S6R4W6_TRIMR